MSTSTDEATRLCLTPPGGAPDGTATESFIGNVFSGHMPYRGNGPSFALGAGNFSIEAWLRFATASLVSTQIGTHGGGVGNSLLVNGVGIASLDAIVGQYAEAVAGVIQTAVTSGVLGRWVYAAVNFTRGGNMEVFVDGNSRTTIAIPANAIGAEPFDIGLGSASKIAYDDASSFSTPVGPVAMHSVVLTAAQIAQSYWNHTVNNLGAASTYLLYNWLVEGHTGWDFTRANMLGVAQRSMITYSNAAAPLGANGTVRIRDRSGNNRHWTVQTAASYTTVNANKAEVVFAADPFFS